LAEVKHRLDLLAVQSDCLAKSRDIAQVVGRIDEFGQNEPDVAAVEARAGRQFPAFDQVAPHEIGEHERPDKIERLFTDEAKGPWIST